MVSISNALLIASTLDIDDDHDEAHDHSQDAD
jgi:hypothetical protein